MTSTAGHRVDEWSNRDRIESMSVSLDRSSRVTAKIPELSSSSQSPAQQASKSPAKSSKLLQRRQRLHLHLLAATSVPTPTLWRPAFSYPFHSLASTKWSNDAKRQDFNKNLWIMQNFPPRLLSILYFCTRLLLWQHFITSKNEKKKCIILMIIESSQWAGLLSLLIEGAVFLKDRWLGGQNMQNGALRGVTLNNRRCPKRIRLLLYFVL